MVRERDSNSEVAKVRFEREVGSFRQFGFRISVKEKGDHLLAFRGLHADGFRKVRVFKNRSGAPFGGDSLAFEQKKQILANT